MASPLRANPGRGTPRGRQATAQGHLFVGSPRNIDILLRALLLDLHPTSPPSHTCLVMKYVLVSEYVPPATSEQIECLDEMVSFLGWHLGRCHAIIAVLLARHTPNR